VLIYTRCGKEADTVYFHCKEDVWVKTV